MATEQVHVIGHVAAEPAEVWAVVGNFCGAWHPAIAEMRLERDARGALIRAFTAKGEDTLYREQLTYRSDSDRVLAYTHLEGIAGAERYDARLQVFADETGGSRIEWSARLSASADRAPAIAAGTKAIFEMDIAALDDIAGTSASDDIPSVEQPDAALESVFIAGEPKLALTVTPQRPGPLVLFLHGIGGARTNWLAQLHAVAPTLRAAALDLRGYGESRLGPSQSTVEDYCDDIRRVAEALGATRLVLCGLSYGSWIATSFAMRHPEMLAGLVLSGGCTGMSEAEVAEREAFRTAREVPLDAGKTPADFAPAVVDVLAGPNAGEAVRQALFTSMAAIPAATYRDALHCFTHPPERFDFSRLTMPVLMMTGRFDRLAAPEEIRGVANRIAEVAPRACVRFEVIEDAGHVCNVERPGAYNRVLGEFLSEIAR
ncbi:alpha/beta fold hydrolase [Sinorhizobium sp. RAC02]|uniref:alpha/beta fold hydrolase n=1 Tax=Sinorhizobium sp. RAC02 TaxID=1842534 RepID=UPI00083CDFF6|nr:alpha/beta fold hydrolase [Sinorhizobium sp. RAC02]AOF92878.1 alpha/beta hydrolase family protein [Sinorhizobium sp. RAC02]